MVLSFLICSVSASWLEARTTLRPTWIALAALGISLALGLPYLLLFRVSMGAPLVAALAADVCLIILLILTKARSAMKPDGHREAVNTSALD
jgi:hypothetical protein